MAQSQGHRTDVMAWDDYFMAFAFLAAKRSKDPSTQVGACIVNEAKRIVSTGYNGMPNGCDDAKLPWSKADKTKDKTLFVCRAELNAIVNKNSADVKGCTMYVTHFPCNECAKLIIQSGITKVIYVLDKHPTRKDTIASREMFLSASVKTQQFKNIPQEVVIKMA